MKRLTKSQRAAKFVAVPERPSPSAPAKTSSKRETVEQFEARGGVKEILPGLQLQPSRRIFDGLT